MKAGEQPAFVFAAEFMFPEAEDAPALGAERAGDEAACLAVALAKAIAGAVGGDFLLPEGDVRFGSSAVERAAVPEAAVDEDGEFEFGKREVWTADGP